MDWKERVDNIKFSIQTGDGKTYFPLYKGGETEREYNTSSFEFISVYGTLVDRKKPKSRKLPLVFWFQGADNIEQADEFEISADDPRPWTVVHPFYGTISGQPISIKRDDSSLNITEVTVPFWESIDADYPISNFTVKDNTRDRHDLVYSLASLSAVTNVKFASSDIPKQAQSIIDMSGEMKSIQDNNTYADFQNALNAGLKAIDGLLDGPLNAIQSIQNFLDLPATYEQAIEGRIASYENIYRRLKTSITTLADKKYFESMGGSVIASMSMVAVNPQFGDYVLVSDVEKMTSRIASIYKDYSETLDSLKVSVYDVNNTYNADASVQSEVSSLVNYTIANLYNMSFETKRERIVIVDKKTNLILLVHRYLGLDDEDENIDTFIKTNNLKFNQLFAVEKGTEIKYAK
jgi:hypothetical protein